LVAISGGSQKFDTFDYLWQNNNCNNDDNITCFITKRESERYGGGGDNVVFMTLKWQ
jgi:hypothetical protein